MSDVRDTIFKVISAAPASPPREPELLPPDQPPKLTDVETCEYECGAYCDGSEERGCPGHDTDIPVAITLDSVRFVVEGYDAGDYPGDRATVEEVQNVVSRLDIALNGKPKRSRADDLCMCGKPFKDHKGWRDE
jgi:hypothetical protein